MLKRACMTLLSTLCGTVFGRTQEEFRMKIAIISLQFEETATGGGGVHVESFCKK